MDIIAEILDADRLAEEALVKAEQDKAELLKKAAETSRSSEEQARQQILDYRREKEAALDAETEKCLKEIDGNTEQEKKALDAVFEKCHKSWEDEIFSRLTALP